jgi:opacity protein-like surface antigen
MIVRVGLVVSSLALLLVAAPAAAQDETPRPAPPPVPAPAAAEGKAPSISLALERVGGIGYARAASSEANTDASVSLTALGVGGVTLNPFAVPRIGVDFILPSNITLGGAVGFTHLSSSASNNGKSQDLGSVFLYSVTPRVGYRIPLSESVDLTPRGGLTFAGASGSLTDSNVDASIFAIALSADAPLAFRLTDSFNILVGAGIDYTVSANVTTTTKSGTTTTSNSEEVKGSLFSLQAWLGVGGYL